MPNTTFCANTVCKTIKDYLVAQGFEAYNDFGKKVEDRIEAFTRPGVIWVLYDGATYKPSGCRSIIGRIKISFLVIDVTVGTAADKDPFTIDNLRQYLAAGNQAWQELGLPTAYPALNFEPYMLENEIVWRFEDGISWTLFTGYLQYHQDDLV